MSTEPTIILHVRALRELSDEGSVHAILWCANRDMSADPLTKGETRRDVLNEVVLKGEWIVAHE
eukprot:2918368-Prorocentrum_lima.AAC.1